MSAVISRWVDKHGEKQGPYAAFVGFEEDIKVWAESLELAYDDLDIYAQIALFGFVTELLCEERCGSAKSEEVAR